MPVLARFSPRYLLRFPGFRELLIREQLCETGDLF
jgi:hypothetical protein